MTEPPQDPLAGAGRAIEPFEEVVDAVPVSGERPLARQPGRRGRSVSAARAGGGVAVPAIQAAAAAAGGFVAGAAVVRLAARRRRTPSAAAARSTARVLSRRAPRGGGLERLHVVASRSLLLDVHLLGTPSTDR